MTLLYKLLRPAWHVRPFVYCILAGALSSLAMAPINAWYALFPGLGILYYALTRAETGSVAFWRGWFFAMGYFVFSLSWVGNALLVEGNPYRWVWPLAVLGLPSLLALFPAGGCLLAWRCANLRKISGYLAFAASLTLFEWLRGHVFTGFPWNLMGYSWADNPEIIQLAASVTVYGLTWMTFLWCSIFGFAAVCRGALRNKLLLAVFLITSFLACKFYGYERIENYAPAYHENIQIKLVQPNIAQHEKWDADKMAAHFFKHIRLSYPDQSTENKITYIIWPETALSHRFLKDKAAMDVLRQTLETYPDKAYLITGLLDYTAENGQSHNRLVMIDQNGEILHRYDKHHPVPFGEYIPFQKWIPLEPVVKFQGFTKGPGPAVLKTPQNLLYTPLICYEVIFPGLVFDYTAARPDFILNVTNDAWYGHSAGPYQHFVQARFRALEEKQPLIRAANTGISGMIDPLGLVIYETPIFTAATQTLKLPKSLPAPVLNSWIKAALIPVLTLPFLMFSYWKKQLF